MITKGERRMKKNIVTIATLLAGSTAFAEDGVQQVVAGAASAGISNAAFYAIAAALVLCLAAFAGALAQGRIAAAAMEGISRNPQAQKNMFVPMILGLVFVETLVLFSFVIANTIAGKF